MHDDDGLELEEREATKSETSVDGCSLILGSFFIAAVACGIAIMVAYTLRHCYEILTGIHQ